jgi:hypothetical protein
MDEPGKPSIGERIAETRKQEQGPFVIGGFVVRIAMLVPVIALSVASVALIIYGALETRHLLGALFGGQAVTRDEAILLAIEIVDLFSLQRWCRWCRWDSTSSISGRTCNCPNG